MTADKVKNGQFYTKGNPFNLNIFKDWLINTMKTNEYNENTPIVEPFAGANHIIKSMNQAGFIFNNWNCFDIEPEAITENVVPEFQPTQNDSIKNYPTGFPLCVTNPPYLAKNSAKRKGYTIEFDSFADLYQVSLHKMLVNNAHIAAIIPESFITSKAAKPLKSRCSHIISLTAEMFDDTEHPVCLALFDNTEHNDISIYSADEYIGELSDLRKESENLLAVPASEKHQVLSQFKITFNSPNGEISFRGIDGTKKPTIEFDTGNKLAPEKVKHSSRSLTRISVEKQPQNLPKGLFATVDETIQLDTTQLITDANSIINSYREITSDVFMTSFKGIRKDSKYRRRLDFATARKILIKAIAQQL